MRTTIIISFLFLVPLFANAQSGFKQSGIERAKNTIEVFKDVEPALQSYFDNAYGYVVFPSIGKGASGIGGAHGKGIAFEQNTPIGKATIAQVTIGLQFGGQSYSQIVFFENQEDFEAFKGNQFQFAAQVSAVALTEGAAANLEYRDGVSVFTQTKGGLMYEASIGGQKLKFKPFKEEN